MTIVADRETFRGIFGSFSLTSNSKIDYALEMAALQVAPSVWGDRLPVGILYLAAHLLSNEPGGQNARNTKGGTPSQYQASTYGQTFERMLMEVSPSGYRVVIPPEDTGDEGP